MEPRARRQKLMMMKVVKKVELLILIGWGVLLTDGLTNGHL